jgi:hypothetical protein
MITARKLHLPLLICSPSFLFIIIAADGKPKSTASPSFLPSGLHDSVFMILLPFCLPPPGLRILVVVVGLSGMILVVGVGWGSGMPSGKEGEWTEEVRRRG